jgi:regulator of replication initiation timing
MPETATSPTLLDELDERQDEVLAQLDQLNARIEKLLEEYTHTRLHELSAATA